MSTPVGAKTNLTAAEINAINEKGPELNKLTASLEKYHRILQLYQTTTPQAQETMLQTVIPGAFANLEEAKKILDAIEAQLNASDPPRLSQARVTQINESKQP